MTFVEAAARARAALAGAGVAPATAALDADLLARHAAGWDLATWLLRRQEPADAAFSVRYDALIARRLTREPVAYIRGVQEFWGRDFLVTPAVLIPRPETELLVEAASRAIDSRGGLTVVDIGTGSGCIAVTLAAEHPALTIHAVDISDEALAVARQNAVRHGVGDRVRFLQGAYLADTPRPIDVIVTNPPYVAQHDEPGLSPEVRDHEPSVALFGGEDGWRDIRVILRQAAQALREGGHLLMELGYGQSEHVANEIAAVAGLRLEVIGEDLQGIPRVAVVRRG